MRPCSQVYQKDQCCNAGPEHDGAYQGNPTIRGATTVSPMKQNTVRHAKEDRLWPGQPFVRRDDSRLFDSPAWYILHFLYPRCRRLPCGDTGNAMQDKLSEGRHAVGSDLLGFGAICSTDLRTRSSSAFCSGSTFSRTSSSTDTSHSLDCTAHQVSGAHGVAEPVHWRIPRLGYCPVTR